MKTLADFKPTPKAGEWFSVTIEGKGTRVVAIIEKDPSFARLSMGDSLKLNNFSDPIKISKKEAQALVERNIHLFEVGSKQGIFSEEEKEAMDAFLQEMKNFHKTYFEKSNFNLN